jgi:hypothetical protein
MAGVSFLGPTRVALSIHSVTTWDPACGPPTRDR